MKKKLISVLLSAAVLPQPASIVVAIAALSNTLISFFFQTV